MGSGYGSRPRVLIKILVGLLLLAPSLPLALIMVLRLCHGHNGDPYRELVWSCELGFSNGVSEVLWLQVEALMTGVRRL